MSRVSIVDLHVGRKVRVARLDSGFSISEMAQRLAIAIDEYEQLEKGKVRFTAVQLRDVASATRVNVGVFFDGLEFPSRTPTSTSSAEVLDFRRA